jgi:hypothetical protein
VVQSVTSTQVSGHPAQHLQLLIDPECPANEGYVALEAASGSRGLNYPRPRPLTIDFWVVDVDGTPVVLDTWSQLGAPEELVDTATETSESASFVTD